MSSAMISASQTNMPVVNTGSLAAYLDSVQRIPVLSREEEVALFTSFEETGDVEAARRIVMSHLRYVVYVARSYMGYGLSLEDLVQQGNIGLMKSVKRFSLAHNVRLVSFAVHWIKAEIHEFILKNWKIVKVATTKAQRKLFFNLRKQKARLGWFSDAESARVADDLGVKQREVIEMEARLHGRDESFDKLSDDDDDTESSPAFYLTQGVAEYPSYQVEMAEEAGLNGEGLHEALEMLDDRSRDIVMSRWLGESKMSLKELALKYGVSLERIRQIEAMAFQTMQPVIASAG